MNSNVTPLRGDIEGMTTKSAMVSDFARGIETFQEESPVTGAVWVIFDDTGGWRTGWTAEASALPATAIIGMATRALCALRTD